MKMRINEVRLFGAVIGDIAGSAYEFRHNKDYNCNLFPNGCDFTDDTILTAATALAMVIDEDFASAYKSWGRTYQTPKGGYGGSFSEWLRGESYVGYNSLGNGSAMRVAPCAYYSHDWYEVLDIATRSALATHSHWQGIRAAQAVADCIFLLNHGNTPEQVAEVMRRDFGYDIPLLEADYETQQELYFYSERADETVPMAVWCALSSTSFEDAIRKAVALGGDADTLGAITGSIAECIHEIPQNMMDKARAIIDHHIENTIIEFNKIFSKR